MQNSYVLEIDDDLLDEFAEPALVSMESQQDVLVIAEDLEISSESEKIDY